MTALLIGAGAVHAALDFPSVPTYSPGSHAELKVGATTPSGASALQFTVTLPDGFSLYNTTVKLDKTRATDHIYRLNKVSDSSYKCVIYSNNNTSFASTSGKLFSLTLKTASTAAKGDYTLSFTEIRCADASGNETTMPDAAANLSVIIPAQSVAITPSPADIRIGETLRLTAAVSPAEASQDVTWSSSNTSKVTVSEDGTVTGVAVGYANITAKTTDGSNRSASCRVNVSKVGVTGVVISRESLEMFNGTTAKLTATVLPENATNKALSWSSNSYAVAVDSEGNLTARSDGMATITVVADDNPSARATCVVKVLKKQATSLSVFPETLSMEVNDTEALSANVKPWDASQDVKWSSSDAAVASVDETGFVTALSAGTAVVTAATLDGSGLTAECKVTVKPARVSSVTIDQKNHYLYLGESEKLTATVLPENAGNRVLLWKSSNDEVATVDENGCVVAVDIGTTTITATSTDGTYRSGRCQIIVVRPPAASIKIVPAKLDMRMNEKAALKAVVEPATASQEVVWYSENPDIADVDDTGSVTAYDEGTAVIIAETTDGSGLTARCVVTIGRPLAASVVLSKTSLLLTIGEGAVLTAKAQPGEASQTFEWYSSDDSVVSVDADGHVTARAEGSAVITVAATDGSGCKANCNVTVVKPKASAVTIEPASLDLILHETASLKAVVEPSTALQSVVWKSSDTGVASVSSDGVVEAAGTGSAVITAIAADGSGAYAECIVTVRRPLATSVTMNETSLSLYVNDIAVLTAEVYPKEALQEVKWYSSDISVATVDTEGRVTAHAAGIAAIEAGATDGSGVYALCIVTVLVPPAESITLDCDRLELETEDIAMLTASIMPAEAVQTVRFSSSEPSVASVDENGIVTAIAPGMAAIIATTTDGTGLTDVCMVTVKEKSGIDDIETEVPVVFAHGSDIVIRGVADSVEIRVSDVTGAIVYRGYEHYISGLAPGLHIVIIGTKAYKIVLN